MLGFYHALARRLFPFRVGLWLLVGACVVVFLAALFVMDSVTGHPWLLGSVVMLIWLLSALSVVHGFSEPLPRAPREAGFLVRAGCALKRAYLWLMAAVASIVSVGVVVLSLRAVGILLGD